MKHGGYIKEFCWQLLKNSASILLYESHSWHPLLSLSLYRKPEMYILHWIEVYSILGIFVCLVHNMFRGFLYVYDINYEYPVTYAWQVFVILDLIFSPVCVLIYIFVIKTICNKTKCKIKSFYLFLRREYWTFAPWNLNGCSLLKENRFQEEITSKFSS